MSDYLDYRVQTSKGYNNQNQNFIDHMTTLPENEWDDEIENFTDYVSDYYYGTSNTRYDSIPYPPWKQNLYKIRAPVYNRLYPTYDEPLPYPQLNLNPEVSREASTWGSTLAATLANYGIKSMVAAVPSWVWKGGLAGLAAGGLTYGGLTLYDYIKNKRSKPMVNAGIDVTSKDFSSDFEHKQHTNILLNPSDVEIRSRIKPLIKRSIVPKVEPESIKYYPVDAKTKQKINRLSGIK